MEAQAHVDRRRPAENPIEQLRLFEAMEFGEREKPLAEPLAARKMTAIVLANSLPTTAIHPVAITIPLICAGYLCAAFWVTFAGGEASLILAIVAFITAMFLGLFAACGGCARNVQPERASTRSLREFLNGDVEIETGLISGREALLQMATLPVALAVGGTVILVVAAWARP